MALTMTHTLRTALGLCLEIKGAFGGIHFRKLGTQRTIVYRERVRTSAPTAKQLAHRVKFLRAYEQWESLSAAQQADWETVARRFSTRQIASHLFLRCWWYQEQSIIDQALRWLNITLHMPGP